MAAKDDDNDNDDDDGDDDGDVCNRFESRIFKNQIIFEPEIRPSNRLHLVQ